eukprot:COSAG05_NODE_1832_length_3998_cov_11.418312_5_plen_82_part_00
MTPEIDLAMDSILWPRVRHAIQKAVKTTSYIFECGSSCGVTKEPERLFYSKTTRHRVTIWLYRRRRLSSSAFLCFVPCPCC